MNAILGIIFFTIGAVLIRFFLFEIIKTNKERVVYEEISKLKKLKKTDKSAKYEIDRALFKLRFGSWKYALKRMAVNYITMLVFAWVCVSWFGDKIKFAILWYILGVIIFSYILRKVFKWY